MLYTLFETFINEIKKEENQKQINDFLGPYLNTGYYVLLSLFILLIANLLVSLFIFTKLFNKNLKIQI